MDVTSRINFYINNDQAKKALLELERQYNDNTAALIIFAAACQFYKYRGY